MACCNRGWSQNERRVLGSADEMVSQQRRVMGPMEMIPEVPQTCNQGPEQPTDSLAQNIPLLQSTSRRKAIEKFANMPQVRTVSTNPAQTTVEDDEDQCDGPSEEQESSSDCETMDWKLESERLVQLLDKLYRCERRAACQELCAFKLEHCPCENDERKILIAMVNKGASICAIRLQLDLIEGKEIAEVLANEEKERQMRIQKCKDQKLREQQCREKNLREQHCWEQKQLLEQQCREQQCLKEKQSRELKELRCRMQQQSQECECEASKDKQMREEQCLKDQQCRELQQMKEQHCRQQQQLKEKHMREIKEQQCRLQKQLAECENSLCPEESSQQNSGQSQQSIGQQNFTGSQQNYGVSQQNMTQNSAFQRTPSPVRNPDFNGYIPDAGVQNGNRRQSVSNQMIPRGNGHQRRSNLMNGQPSGSCDQSPLY